MAAGPAPYSGDCGSAMAFAIIWSRRAVAAVWTAALIMPEPADPTVAATLGRSVSP